MARIIGLSGLAGSGKTEAAKTLEAMGFVKISFATPLKKMLEVLVPPGTDKTDCPPLLQGQTYRKALQTLGTDWGRQMIGEQIWCDAAMHMADALLASGKDVVIDDVRFNNEAEAIINRGGSIFRVLRPGLEVMEHASEKGVDNCYVRTAIHNEASVGALRVATRAALTLAYPDQPHSSHLMKWLENRHQVILEWGEPWPASGPEGNDLDAHVTLRATVHDCINLSRAVARSKGLPTQGNDAEFLLDFIAVHWAEPVKQHGEDTTC